jgi:hypothetical protein
MEFAVNRPNGLMTPGGSAFGGVTPVKQPISLRPRGTFPAGVFFSGIDVG